MPPASPRERAVFYSRFNRVLAVVLWALSVFAAVSLFLVPPGAHLYYLVPCAFVALFAWEILWHPQLHVDDDAVHLTNALRSVSIPWPALVHVDTKYALTLYTPGRRYSAWAAPAPGRGTTFRASRSGGGIAPRAVPLENGAARPGDLLGTESGEAAQLVRARWSRLRDAGLIETGVADATPVQVSWHVAADAGLVVLAAASVAAVLLA